MAIRRANRRATKSRLRNVLGLIGGAMLLFASSAWPDEPKQAKSPTMAAADTINQLDEPLYSPFIERYMLDELKALRTELLEQRAEYIEQFSQRQLKLADHAVSYSTDTVTYFFYLVAGASSLLLLIGWTSVRDIKERALKLTDEEVTKLISRYEKRLKTVEETLDAKERLITQNRTELDITNEVHSLWLRASQDVSPENQIVIYDQILALRPKDVEAFSYKADAALELNEPKWATNLCRQALAIDPDNGHALYQLACACASLGQLDDAVGYLEKALNIAPSYMESAESDPLLKPLSDSGQLARLQSLAASPPPS